MTEKRTMTLVEMTSQRIISYIIDHKMMPGDQLPTEVEFLEKMEVSRGTLREAFKVLVARNILEIRQGAGTFVAARVEKSFSKLSSFTEDMISRGRVPHSTWLSRSEGQVTPEESLTLGLSPGAPVYRFSRIRYADGAPMALEYSTLAAFCMPSSDFVETSLYEALEKTGHRPVRALQRLRAVLFTSEQAELLKVAPRDPGLLIERRGFLKDGRAVEVTQSYYRGDAYDFVAELNAI